MIRYNLGSQITRYETKRQNHTRQNLENVSFKSWDQDFLNLA
jgi:hypothetical protein